MSLFAVPWEDILFKKVFPHLSLKDLFQLGAVSSTGVQCIDQYLSKLKVLDLSAPKFIFFSSSAFQRLTKNCTNLEKVLINECTHIRDAELSAVFSKNKQIKQVDLSGCNLKGTCLLSLAVNCKGLKSLALRGSRWLNVGALETIMTHLCNLEDINFASCHNISETHLKTFFQKFSRLKKIRLSHIATVNDSTLFCLSRHCRMLEHLDIRACTSVTDHGIRCLSEYCSLLTNLEVLNCHQVTEMSLNNLRSRQVSIDVAQPQNYTPTMIRHKVLMQV